jgi:hypothetical protein
LCTHKNRYFLKNEYQVNPWGKGGWCVRLTTYQEEINVKKSGGLNLLETEGLFRPVMGQLYLYLL